MVEKKEEWKKIRKEADRLWGELHAHISELHREGDMKYVNTYHVAYAALKEVLENLDTLEHFDPETRGYGEAIYAATMIRNILTGMKVLGLWNLKMADRELYKELMKFAKNVLGFWHYNTGRPLTTSMGSGLPQRSSGRLLST